MDDEEVLKVLEEETGEVLRGSPIHTLSAQDSQHLYPGQDFKNGVLHYTFPLFDVREEKQGKSKDAPTVPKRYVYTGCVTGEHELFMYDTVELHDRGFMRPDHFLDADTGWNGDEARAFASGKATIPDAYDLYLRVRGVYEKYIEFSEEILYDVMTTWVISTYMFRVFNTFSYLHFNGSAASGKSQNLRILTAIGFNAQWTAQLTAANIYRSITNNPGVLCIDEAESFDGDRGQALRDVLRNGYMAGSHVKRQRSKASGDMVEDRFEVYGPKALASINPLDGVTGQRALVVNMRPALRTIPFFDADSNEWSALSRDLRYWALANAGKIREQYARWTDNLRGERAPELFNRAWELSAHIVTTADYIGGEDMSSPLISWLTTYFAEQRKQQDNSDLMRIFVTSLPSLMRQQPAHEGWYYPVRDVLDNMLVYLDEDVSDRLKSSTIWRKLAPPLGLKNIKAARGGKQIQIEEEAVRQIFKERRIQPNQEDVAWLEGNESLQSPERIIEVKQTGMWETDGDS